MIYGGLRASIFTDKVQASPLIVSLAAFEANVDEQFDMRIFVGAASHFVFVSRNTRDHFPMRLRPSNLRMMA